MYALIEVVAKKHVVAGLDSHAGTATHCAPRTRTTNGDGVQISSLLVEARTTPTDSQAQRFLPVNVVESPLPYGYYGQGECVCGWCTELHSFIKCIASATDSQTRDPVTLVKQPRVRVELQWLLPYRSLTTKPPELRFHALLSDGAREVRFERVGTC